MYTTQCNDIPINYIDTRWIPLYAYKHTLYTSVWCGVVCLHRILRINATYSHVWKGRTYLYNSCVCKLWHWYSTRQNTQFVLFQWCNWRRYKINPYIYTVKHVIYDTPNPKLKCFSSRLEVVFAQSIEARYEVENDDVVGAVTTGNAPTTSR